MKRVVAAASAALLLSGCSGPLFVPDAGPNAPGYVRKAPPLAPPGPPRVELRSAPVPAPTKAGGSIDSVARGDGSFTVTGWAQLAAERPRGVLRLVLPDDVTADVETVVNMQRPDVATATSMEDLAWSGFTITVQGTLPDDAGVCVVSRSSQGTYLLAGSDASLCPAE